MNRTMKITAALCWIAVSLSGCATYHAQPVAPAALMNAFDARTLDDPELRRYLAAHCGGACTPGVWDLNTLTLAAFYYSPTLDIARARHGTSEAVIQSAGQYPNPALQLPLGYTSNAKPGESPYTYGLGLDIPIETAGKRGYRIEQARQLSNAARFNIGNVAWQVRSRLRNGMLILYTAIRRASILEQQLAVQQQVVGMLDKRLSFGAASELEDNQVHITLTQNRHDLANAQKQIADARAQMAATIGVPVSAMRHVDVRFDAFERVYHDMPVDAARRQAILNRADLLAAISEYEAGQAALQLEIYRQYPDIHIGPGYTFDAGAHKFLLPVSGITLPLFNQNQGPIAEATARSKELAARVNALQAQAIDDTDRAVQNYRAALQNLQLADALLSAQQRQLQGLQRVFQAGELDRLALTLAQYEFYTNTLARQDALMQVQQHIGQLEDAIQRPLSTTGFPVIPDTGD
jgi:cobalt-zinc-cadmium efflux system outer membrane protein